MTALAPSTETWLFVALYLAFFALLVVALPRARRRAPGARRRGGRPGRGGAAVRARCCRARQLDRVPFGVVLPDAVAVKEGADVNYRTSFELHAGLRVRLLERDQDWLRVRLANGLEGWVRASQIGTL